MIAACRHYEMTGDPRYRQIGQFFYETVTESRRYATGGTSNNEAWLTEAGHLAAEWKQATDTAECCCVYNMLKLARNLYEWSGDPRYFDYYERTLLNHRLGTIDIETGNTMYYLSHTPGAWKTFCSEYDSFWCCTGTGVEEYSKLNNSIYFFDQDGLYVNLFVSSDLTWKDKGLTIQQQTQYPTQDHTTADIQGRTAGGNNRTSSHPVVGERQSYGEGKRREDSTQWRAQEATLPFVGPGRPATRSRWNCRCGCMWKRCRTIRRSKP